MKFSVGARLLLFACVVMLLLLPLAGTVIGKAFERSAVAGLEARLEAYASALAGLIEVQPQDRIGFSRPPRELRFDQVYSGWYWQISRQGKVLLTSRSLWDSSLDGIADSAAPARRIQLAGPRDEALLAQVLRLRLAGVADPVELVVTAPLSEIRPELLAFRKLLVLALGSLGVMLVAVFALQIRWGLAPLRSMERDLQAVRQGRRARVDPALPADLREVAGLINEVLAYQEDLIERARSTAGNLAHALKTPLATMRLRVAAPVPDAAGLREDLAQVQDIVEHHLARAAAAGRAAGRHRHTDLRSAVEPVIVAVRGMSRERAVEVELAFAGEADVAVDPQDLQELVGNLLENGVKWARRRVCLQVTATAQTVHLQIDDDGPGIPDDARARAVDRGIQLDRHSQGSGLGLAIVRDIATLYRIDFQLERSAMGGLSARLALPRETAAVSGA